MRKYLIVHNSNSKDSREFIENNQGYEVIDFYNYQDNRSIWFKNLEIPVAEFPSVVDVDLKLVSAKPSDMASAIAELKATNEYKVARAVEDIDFGKKIIAMVRVSSVDRGLTEEQTDIIEAAVAPIIAKLNLGKIEQAQALIDGVTPDGTLITADLRKSILTKIEQYLAE